MRKSLIFSLFFFAAFSLSAQFHANTLVVESADTATFTLSIGGTVMNKVPATKVVVEHVYGQDANVTIRFTDPKYAPIEGKQISIVRVKKKKENFAPTCYRAKYVVKAKKGRSKLKMHSIVSKI